VSLAQSLGYIPRTYPPNQQTFLYDKQTNQMMTTLNMYPVTSLSDPYFKNFSQYSRFYYNYPPYHFDHSQAPRKDSMGNQSGRPQDFSDLMGPMGFFSHPVNFGERHREKEVFRVEMRGRKVCRLHGEGSKRWE
jgi:hypothetical protein